MSISVLKLYMSNQTIISADKLSISFTKLYFTAYFAASPFLDFPNKIVNL